jgi:hypothetical protein
VSESEICARLRQARAVRGEDLAALGKRIGVRQEHLRAIEEDRLGDLPAGIYGRAAVRAFAAALGFDPVEVLRVCEPHLAPVDEPIAALARLRGIRREPSAAPQAAALDGQPDPADDFFPGWRHLAAAAVDAIVIVGLLLVVVAAALTLLTVPVSALKDAGLPFGLMGVLLAGGYFLCFGGVRGATIGERALHVEAHGHQVSTVTLRLVAERALLSATEDVRCIERLGARLARLTAAWMAHVNGAVKG